MRIRSTLLLMLGIQLLSAQNIIQNGDFESFDKWAERQYCQYSDVEYFTFYVQHWNTPSQSSPDYFTYHPKRRCNLFPVKPHSGHAYLGLTLYTERGFNEYINNTLAKPMEKGKQYYLEYWVALYHKPDKIYAGHPKGRATYFHPANDQGFYFHKPEDGLTVHMDPLIDVRPQINIDSVIVTPRGKWQRVSHLYTPDDAYTHLVFGDFYPEDAILGPCEVDVTRASNFSVSKEAYYYFDDFFMARAVSDFRAASTYDEVPLQAVNSADLLFETKSAKITDTHTNQIKEAWTAIKAQQIINISIRGYADNVGSKALNDSLSAARASNAKATLEALGAPSNVIKITGYGSTGATADNRTASGRELNRRVEITFHIKGNTKQSTSDLFEKYLVNDRSKMIGTPLVIAHNHLDLTYPLKALIYPNGSVEPDQIMEIKNADQIVYGLFKDEQQYKVILVNEIGNTWQLDVH